MNIPATAVFYPESTARFAAYRDPQRRGIDGEPSSISEILYRTNENVPWQEFAHCWKMHNWAPEDEGKWTMNRSDVCIANEWWPSEYQHDSLQKMLDHLEATFIEGVPANQPD